MILNPDLSFDKSVHFYGCHEWLIFKLFANICNYSAVKQFANVSDVTYRDVTTMWVYDISTNQDHDQHMFSQSEATVGKISEH